MIVSLYLLFEILSIVLCLHYLYGEKFRFDKVTIVFLIVEITWMQMIYYMQLDQNWSLVIHPIIMLYCGFRFGFKLMEIIVNNILYIILLGIMQTTIMFIFNTIFRPDKITELISLAMNILVFLIVLGVLRHFNLSKISRIVQSKEKILKVSILVAMCGASLCLLFYKGKQGFDIAYYLIFVLSVVLMVLVILDIGKHKLKTREMEAELRLHKLYEQSFQKLIEDICARQHEFDNHINTIYSQHFLCNTYEELVKVQREYCRDIVSANTYNKLLSKGNPTVLGFLYGKFTEIDRLGIELSYKVNIRDLECEIPIYKIVEILGNLIDNAIEALQETVNINRLNITLKEDSEKIVIQISNECNNVDYSKVNNFFKKGYSEKGQNRGYGLYNVKKICDDYGVEVSSIMHTKNEVKWLEFTLIINKSL